MSSEPLDEIQWKSPEWIQQFGLHSGNVLDYFSELPFYDRTSNNQVIKMQFQFQQVPPGVSPQQYMQDKLVEMVGLEIMVAYVKEPDFWIIRRQKRLLPQAVVVQNDYYIVGANVYQLPRIYDVLSSRLLASVHLARQALDTLNQMGNFDIGNGGHLYPLAQSAATALAAAAANGTANGPATATDGGTATPMAPSVLTAGLNTVGPASVGTANAATSAAGAAVPHISGSTFDGLLAAVVGLEGQSVYLDDIPMYGKGSTVERFEVRQR
jgi:mediator of RNA polymerase II transcription subunit 6